MPAIPANAEANCKVLSLSPTVPDPSICAALLNTWSLSKHATEIHDLIVCNSLDLLAITESWLHPASGPALSLAVPPNYSIIRADRLSGKGGGVALIFKSDFSLRLIDTHRFCDCDILTAKLTTSPTSTINICLIYRPPGPTYTFEDDLSSLLSSAIKPSTQYLVLGDINLGLNDASDSAAFSLKSTLNNLGFLQRVEVPTHRHGRTLDWVATLNLNVLTSILPCPWSDHDTILISISLPSKPKRTSLIAPSSPLVPTRNRRNITASSLAPLISKLADTCLSDSVHDLAAHYTQIITTAIDTIAPLKCRTTSPRTTKSKHWYTDELHNLLASKRSQEALWRKEPSPVSRAAYLASAKLYKTAVVSAKAHSFNSRIESAASNSKELFTILRELESPLP